MNTKSVINPFYCYVFSFGIALYIYSWEWSEIYPALTGDVVFFLISSFLVAIFLGKNVTKKILYINIDVNYSNKRILLLILLSYAIEFMYNGGIPISLIFSGADVAYMDFGIPTFHVILHTFTSFYTIYIFHQYISTKKSQLLLFVFILLIPNILIVNRGAIIMTSTACILIYLFYVRVIVIKKIMILFLVISIFFYGFGYLGNLRSFNGDPTAFLKLTKATDDFIDDFVPYEYYWFYIYASSPFANFQNAVVTSNVHRYDILTFVAWEFLPDFISKRIISMEADYDGINRLDYSINPILTVGSMYFEPFIRMGWYGPVSIFLFYVTFMYIYINLISVKSKYYITGLSILCVMSIFSIFENMLNFSGLCFQLIFPYTLSKLEKYKLIGLSAKSIKFLFLTKKIRFKL